MTPPRSTGYFPADSSVSGAAQAEYRCSPPHPPTHRTHQQPPRRQRRHRPPPRTTAIQRRSLSNNSLLRPVDSTLHPGAKVTPVPAHNQYVRSGTQDSPTRRRRRGISTVSTSIATPHGAAARYRPGVARPGRTSDTSGNEPQPDPASPASPAMPLAESPGHDIRGDHQGVLAPRSTNPSPIPLR